MLNNNLLISIDADSFWGLSSLKILDLDDNQLMSLDANTFKDLSNLQNLKTSSWT